MKEKVKKKLKIYLFRHGQSTYNRDRKFTGHMDVKLTSQGKKHAQTIAKKMKNKRFQVAIHTSLSRSKNTLKPTLEQHPECVIVIQDDRMIERSYGNLQGTTHNQFIKKIGTKEYDWLVHGDYITEVRNNKAKDEAINTLGTKVYDAIHRGWNIGAENGESFADVEKRVRSFITDLKKFMKKHNVSVAISAHGNSIRLFRKIMEKANRKDVIQWFIPYDKVYEYTL